MPRSCVAAAQSVLAANADLKSVQVARILAGTTVELGESSCSFRVAVPNLTFPGLFDPGA